MAVDRRGMLAGVAQALLGGLYLSGAKPTEASAAPIHVLDCQVAGTTYAGLPDDYERGLHPGMRFTCVREPDNPADPLAILVRDDTGRKLGYLPRAKNEVVARLMDAGVKVHAEVEDFERLQRWLKIDVRVYLTLPT